MKILDMKIIWLLSENNIIFGAVLIVLDIQQFKIMIMLNYV